MTLQDYQFKDTNSPWTEMFQSQAEREEAAAMSTMPMADTQEESQPTHDALADVYNRETTNGKRF